jgi:hypothetical protein
MNILRALGGEWPITVAARSKAWTVFARLNTGSRVRIPFEAGMSVCVYSMLVLSCMYVEALRRDDPPPKELYRLCKGPRNWKGGQGSWKGCTAIDWAGDAENTVFEVHMEGRKRTVKRTMSFLASVDYGVRVGRSSCRVWQSNSEVGFMAALFRKLTSQPGTFQGEKKRFLGKQRIINSSIFYDITPCGRSKSTDISDWTTGT